MTNIEKQMKLHRFVEIVKQQDFPFDTHDVEEDLDRVLNYYSGNHELTKEDKTLLKEELAKLAEDEQTREIEKAILKVKYPILVDIEQKKRIEKVKIW